MTDRFPTGTVADWRGQRFEVFGSVPHRRCDGGETVLLVWSTRCMQCGDGFVQMTSRRKLKYPTRRCPRCRRKRR